MAVISYLTRILFDHGAIEAIPAELERFNITRPLIVTDEGIRAVGLLDTLLDALPERMHRAVYDKTPANPTEAAVMEGLALYREEDCDGVIAFGGGSSIDLAKGVRLLTSHAPPLSQYMMVEGGASRIRPTMPPLVAIPTTAGTGSEVGRGAIIILDDGRKLGAVSPHMIPSLAICDPDLTLGLPPGLTAATGMDAMAHCVETYLSPTVNPPAGAIALDGLERVAGFLEEAVADGGDREARWNMMMASMEGAMAFQKGLGAVHAMSHPLGAIRALNLHHGTLNAVVMPAVLRFNASHVGDKMGRIARAMGLSEDADVAEAVEALNERLGLPANLAQMGVSATMIDSLSQQAVEDHCNLTNPRPAGAREYQALFAEALGEA